MSEQSGEMTAIIEELLTKSKRLRETKDRDGLKHAEEAYRIASHGNDKALTLEALKERINYAININGDFIEAEKLSLEYLDRIDPATDAETAARIYNIIGICNDVKGDYIGARNYYMQSMGMLEGRDNLTEYGKIILGNAYHNVVKLYTQLDVDEDRIIYLEKARHIFESVQHADGLARVWNLKAALLPKDTPIEERLTVFEKAYGYYRQSSDAAGRATCIANVGLCYCHIGNFDKGLAILDEALEQVQLSGNRPLLAFTLFQLAEAVRLKGNYEEAIDYLQQAEAILLQANAKVHLSEVYQEWARNLAALGRHEESNAKLIIYIDHIHERLKFDRESAAAEARLKFELEKKEKESEVLRRKNDEIELYNQKLQHSNAELNQFAYVASHDLKEPLRMVTNYMQLLEKSFNNNLNEDQATYIRYATEGARRMYKLIDSLLSYSRTSIDVQPMLVDLNDVLDEVKRVIISSTNRSIQITGDELPTISGDYHQMVQVFQNIIANAVKYNDKDEVIVRINYLPQMRSHKFVIEDNGIGIAPRHREKVFEIFKRLHRHETYSGTGIGLSICQKIITRLNGKIWIEDSSLGGAAFVFEIPKKGMNSVIA